MARRYRRRRQQSSHFLSILIVLLAAAWGLYTKGGDDASGPPANHQPATTQSAKRSAMTQSAKPAATVYGGLAARDYHRLAQLDFKSGQPAWISVNHNHATLIKQAWKVNRVIYSDLDALNRTSRSNTAFLAPRNVVGDRLRVRQYIAPTGWHYNHGRDQIYNRGHLIAYSVSAGIDQSGNYNRTNPSGDQNNPKNLFTQTAYTNQEVQTRFETKVREQLRAGSNVVYQATPIFRGKELMARGINLQAISTDGRLDFNVYIFNVQPGYEFDYATGRAKRMVTLKVAP